MTGSTKLVAVGVLLLAAFAAACRNEGPTLPLEEGPSVMVVLSDTSAAATSAPQGLGSAAAPIVSEAEIAFLSLPPGTVPGGTSAEIRNRRTDWSTTITTLDGGFDPIAIAAIAGDSIETTVSVAGGGQPVVVSAVVPRRRPPLVVRTIPPRGKKDVPLNARLTVVFSEPVDASSLSAISVQRVGDRARVGGSLRLADGEGVIVEFVPDANLKPATVYELVIDESVRDRDGETIDETVVVEFVTTNTLPPAASISIGPDTLRVVPGSSHTIIAYVEAVVMDSDGNEIYPIVHEDGTEIYPIVTWSSSNSDVVDVKRFDRDGERSKGELRSAALAGSATIRAVSGALHDSVVVILEPLAPLSTAAVGANSYACFLAVEGQAYCTGPNVYASTTHVFVDGLGRVSGGYAFVQLATGGPHACGLTADGAAYCWGQSGNGALGQALADDSHVWTPIPVSETLRFREISAGYDHTCGITLSGATYCWGAWMILDGGLAQVSYTPVLVEGGLTFVEISAGGWFTCGLTAAGKAYCWGANSLGQLGNGSLASSTIPVPVAGDLTFAQISAGDQHACALTSASAVYCWGATIEDQVDEGPLVPTPVSLPAGVTITQIDAGFDLTCGVASAGDIYCWGWRYLMSSPHELVPPTRVNRSGFVSVSSGSFMRCAITKESTFYCGF
ncbi:MAG: Ig-like domain-containing protein [Gemmatimonadaceae bacterium]